jgi:hypothetical protein
MAVAAKLSKLAPPGNKASLPGSDRKALAILDIHPVFHYNSAMIHGLFSPLDLAQQLS